MVNYPLLLSLFSLRPRTRSLIQRPAFAGAGGHKTVDDGAEFHPDARVVQTERHATIEMNATLRVVAGPLAQHASHASVVSFPIGPLALVLSDNHIRDNRHAVLVGLCEKCVVRHVS